MTTTTEDQWARPQKVDDVTLAFPATVSHMMPPRQECEAALDALPDRGRTWREFQARWFYKGLPATTTIEPRDGIDPEDAIRHLGAIQGSFAPKHEHKEAAVAYLASRWFESWDPGGKSAISAERP